MNGYRRTITAFSAERNVNTRYDGVMSEALRARAAVAQSLVVVVGHTADPRAKTLAERLRGDADVQRTMSAPPISWVDEAPFVRLLTTVHKELGDNPYFDAVHDATLRMLDTGPVRAARAAFKLFKKPTFANLASWTPRIWALSFQGLTLTFTGERDSDADEVLMVLSEPPDCGFTRPIVLGAAGVMQVTYTLAHVSGRVEVLPHIARDPRVEFRLRRG
jgi:hypothetical protein